MANYRLILKWWMKVVQSETTESIRYTFGIYGKLEAWRLQIVHAPIPVLLLKPVLDSFNIIALRIYLHHKQILFDVLTLLLKTCIVNFTCLLVRCAWCKRIPISDEFRVVRNCTANDKSLWLSSIKHITGLSFSYFWTDNADDIDQ